MSGLVDRLPILLEEAKEDIPYLRRNALNLNKDVKGSASSIFAGVLRFTGIAEYIVNSDIIAFKTNLQESANLYLDIALRFDCGEPISESYMSILMYQSLFDALATGDIELSEKIASVMGGREQIDMEYSHPFDRALGYAIKSVVLNADDQKEKISQFRILVNRPDNRDFIGYAIAFEAILNKNAELFLSALQSVVSGHKKQRRGMFKDSGDEALCVWGVGLANLAKSRGIEYKFDSTLLPMSLII